MTVFDTFSPRSRRAIFWAHYHAQEEHAAEITPEHLLLGLLHEDQDLFVLLMNSNRGKIDSIEQGLSQKPGTAHAKPPEGKLQLSASSKEIIRVAAREYKRFGHKSVATQHLLFALLICPEAKRTWFGRTKKQNPSLARQLLANNGLSATLVEAETRRGIITPQAFALNDPICKLNGQLAAIAELLISKNIFSREEFVALIDKEYSVPSRIVLPLLNALLDKGHITQSEREALQTNNLDKKGPG